MADKKSSSRSKGGSRKEQPASKPSFPFGTRLDPHNPVEAKKASNWITRLRYGHPTPDELDRLLNKDLGLGPLALLFFSRHVKDCEECRAVAEKRGHPSAADLDKAVDKEAVSKAHPLVDPDLYFTALHLDWCKQCSTIVERKRSAL